MESGPCPQRALKKGVRRLTDLEKQASFSRGQTKTKLKKADCPLPSGSSKFFCRPLEFFRCFFIWSTTARCAVSGAPGRARLTGRRTGCLALLVPMLLSGGHGNEDFRYRPCGVRPSASTTWPISSTSPLFQANDTYPPYNIERSGEDQYRITLALAGFAPEDVTITAEQNMLTVEGSKARKDETRISVSGHLGASVPARLQPRRLRAGQKRLVRERAADHRTGARDSRGDEAAPHRHQRRQRSAQIDQQKAA